MIIEKTVKLAIALVAIFVHAPLANPSQKPSSCLSYEPTVVQLKGTIIRKTFPGPPHYDSFKHGDRDEVAWLLVLSEPICTQEDKNDPAMNMAQADIREIQMAFIEADGYKKYKRFVGTKKKLSLPAPSFPPTQAIITPQF